MATSGFPKKKGGEVSAHKASSTLPPFIDVLVLSQGSEHVIYMGAKGIEFTSVPVNLRLNFGTVQTV
jgi:hypothetical protein